MTLTLEIPDDLATRLAAMPENERPNFAIAAMRLQNIEIEEEPDEDSLARMERGLSEVDSKELVGWDDYMHQRRLARQNRPNL